MNSLTLLLHYTKTSSNLHFLIREKHDKKGILFVYANLNDFLQVFIMMRNFPEHDNGNYYESYIVPKLCNNY